MKAKIKDNGDLSLFKYGVWVDAACCYLTGIACCIACPFFGEPKKEGKDAILSLCKSELYLDDFMVSDRLKDD